MTSRIWTSLIARCSCAVERLPKVIQRKVRGRLAMLRNAMIVPPLSRLVSSKSRSIAGAVLSLSRRYLRTSASHRLSPFPSRGGEAPGGAVTSARSALRPLTQDWVLLRRECGSLYARNERPRLLRDERLLERILLASRRLQKLGCGNVHLPLERGSPA